MSALGLEKTNSCPMFDLGLSNYTCRYLQYWSTSASVCPVRFVVLLGDNCLGLIGYIYETLAEAAN